MATTKPPASERVADAFRKLAQSSKILDAAVDEWKTYIAVLNKALRKLHIGVSAWYQISTGGDDTNGVWWSREIGYTEIENDWCIALRRLTGHAHFPEDDDSETTRFEEAPRWLMVEAAAKIPDLLETLTQRTEETTEKVRKRSKEAAEIAAALESIVEEIKAKGASK